MTKSDLISIAIAWAVGFSSVLTALYVAHVLWG